ncbi:MAG: apolipoprotein N-acyltransferase [Actinomycetota bacterium]
MKQISGIAVLPLIFGLGWISAFGYLNESWALPLLFLSGATGFWFIFRSQRIALAGFVFGMGYFLNLIDWLDVIGNDAWIALSILSASWWGIGFWIGQKFQKLTFASVWISAWFVSFELLRDRFPWGGFGWGQFAISTVNNSFLDDLIPLLGQVLLTFLIVFSWVWIARNGIKPKRLLIALAGLFIVGATTPSFSITEISTDYVVGVQGGVVYYPLGEYGPAGEVLAKHVEISLANQEVLKSAELIVWPESAVDIDVTRYPQADEQLQQLAAEFGQPLLVNSVTRLEDERVQNTSYLYSVQGREFVYAKQRLVPFGEFLPLRALIERFTERAAFMPRDFAAGTSSQPIGIDGNALVICFEIADEQIAAVQSDAKILLVQTNNATYQNGDQSDQQLLITRFRAAELAKPTLTIATSGISATIDASGQVMERIEKGDRGILKLMIPSESSSTPASKLAGFAPWAIWGLALCSILYRIKVRA